METSLFIGKTPTFLKSGGNVIVDATAIMVCFDDVRYSLSTSPLNGGFHHTMAIRNQELVYRIETESDLPGGSCAAYLAEEFKQHDLPIHFATALLTSATMDKHAYACAEASDTVVETIATAGCESTAHQAGDGFLYEEKKGCFYPCGTINLLIFTNKALTDGAMTKALITITEAKTAAMHELGIVNTKGDKLATGTATDGIIFTIDPEGEILTDTGTFSLFGDTLAKSVKAAVIQAFHNGTPY